jgi:hypothetical protein
VTLSSTLKGSSVSRVCTIKVFIADKLAPVLTCPNNITQAAQGQVTLVSYSMPNVTDNSGVLVEPVLVQGVRSGYDFQLGSTLIQFSATDPAGNVAFCSFFVNVVDRSPPTFQSCVGYTTAYAQNRFTNGQRLSEPLSWARPAVYDTLDPSPVISYSIPLGSQLPLGETRVNVTAVDVSGNQARCSFTINVQGLIFVFFILRSHLLT